MARGYKLTSVGYPATRLQLVHEAITELRKREKFAFVITHQIMTFIDGLARSPKGKTAAGFDPLALQILPKLCVVIPASTLRTALRDKLVHEFGISPPYALGWQESAYVTTATVKGHRWTVIDVYEMASEFLRYLKSRAALADQRRRQSAKKEP